MPPGLILPKHSLIITKRLNASQSSSHQYVYDKKCIQEESRNRVATTRLLTRGAAVLCSCPSLKQEQRGLISSHTRKSKFGEQNRAKANSKAWCKNKEALNNLICEAACWAADKPVTCLLPPLLQARYWVEAEYATK